MGLTQLSSELEISYRGQRMPSMEATAEKIIVDFKADLDLMTGKISEALLETLNQIYQAIAAEHGNQWPLGGNEWGTSPRQLAVRSGAGLRSIAQSIRIRESFTDGAAEITGSISTGKLTVHETGAVITATRSQYLTIPMRGALDAQGLPLRQRARDWENTFVAQGKSGGLYIFQRQGRQIIPLYMLKKSVTIPPRLRMRQTVSYYADQFGGKLARMFNDGFGWDKP